MSAKKAKSTLLAELPKNLSRARQAAKIDIPELAARADLDAAEIEDWENGKAEPTLFQAADLALALVSYG